MLDNVFQSMKKKIAISQSNYIPWKGYFDLIAAADEFILYDSAQYTKNDWRNRNKIKTPGGVKWLTIPVYGSTKKSINEVSVASEEWCTVHLNTIHQFYKDAPFYNQYRDRINDLYNEIKSKRLSDINRVLLTGICSLLKIRTPVKRSSEYSFSGDATEKLIQICMQSEAEIYLSGPSAKDYLDTDRFADAGIDVEWMNYEDYPIYRQLYPPFSHYVSILDLMFNTGDRAQQYMKHELWRNK